VGRNEAAEIVHSALAVGRRSLTEWQSKALLEAYGIPVPAGEIVGSAAESAAAAQRLGGSVIMKAIGPCMREETGKGLVVPGVTRPLAAADTYRMLETRAGGALEAVFVEEMISSKRELLVSVTRDPVSGLAVAFGLGGVTTEVVTDIASIRAPSPDQEVSELLDPMRATPILGALRGAPVVNRVALASIIRAVAQMALDFPEIAGLEINLLLVKGDRPVAANAVVLLTPQTADVKAAATAAAGSPFGERNRGNNGVRTLSRRWDTAWPPWAPRTVQAEKPLCEHVREWAALTPDHVALSFYGLDITYAELNELADRMAWGLKGLGGRRGDRVAVHMQNCPQFVIAYLGAQRAGAVVVAVNPMLKGAELDYELNDAGAETLIGLDVLYPEVENVRSRTPLKNVILTSLTDFLPKTPIFALPEGRGERKVFADTIDLMGLLDGSSPEPLCVISDPKNDLAILQYTGGTTGTPKGAMITHHSLAFGAVASMHWFRFREDDVFLGVTPFFHVMGQMILMATPLVSGGRVVILDRFVPEVVAQALTHYRCTYWTATTTMIIALLNLPSAAIYDFSSLRFLWTGGAPISVELQDRIKALAPHAAIGEGYGLSESASQGGACTPPFRHKPGFVGIPQIGVEMKIVDEETGTHEMPPNEPGEIIIKAPTVMRGYWNRPEETEQMLRDGWLYTKDTGSMDEEGYVKFLGRTREMIKCSGFSVFPAEVERLLYAHPAVREVAVIGVSDPYRGTSPKAFVVLKEASRGAVLESDIIAWCKENMAAYKRPTSVEFRETLPKTAAGKLQKTVLQQEQAEGCGPS
jgi:long-chain acyl-CoA synthetase